MSACVFGYGVYAACISIIYYVSFKTARFIRFEDDDVFIGDRMNSCVAELGARKAGE